jgi:hypothetical protein
MATRMQQRRGTASQWTAANPILAAGEIGFETDNNRFKIGNGATAWNALDYFANSAALSALLDGAPDALNTLNELAAAINDDPNFFSSISDQIADAIAGAEVDQAALAGVGIDWNAGTNKFDIDSTVATKTYADNAVTVHNQDSTGVHGITDTAALVTLAGTQELSNKTLNSPVINTPSGLLKADVGLGNVDNTSDANKQISTATQTALDLKAPINAPTFTGTVSGITKAMVGLANVDNISDENKPISTLAQAALDAKAPLANPQFTGVVYGVTKAMVGLENVDNTTDLNKPVSTATQSALDAKLSLSGGTLSGFLTAHSSPTDAFHVATKRYVDTVAEGLHMHASVHAASTVNVSANYSNGTSGVGATLTADTNRAFSTIDGESVVLGQRVLIKNQTDAKQNGIYTLTTVGSSSAPWVLTRAEDFNSAAEIHGGDFVFVTGGTLYNNTGWVQTETMTAVGTDSVAFTQFSGAGTYIAGNGLTLTGSSFSADLGVVAPLNNPSFTGTVSGVTKSMVGLGNVDNTTDVNKPVSTATQTALNLKANLNAPTFTGTVSGITKSMVGLGNVDNTADANKPISTATQSALDAKAPISSPTFTGAVTLSSSGIVFADGTQTKEGVPSRTTISQKTDSYTLSSLSERDSLIEINKATGSTLTIPTNATVAWPIGTSIDILQTGAGQVTIAGAAGVTVNATPGLKLRTQWSSATLLKRATDSWVVVGDLTA